MRPEDRLRARFRMFLKDYLLPPARFSAVEHGRKHSGTKEERADEWRRLKAQGVATGLMDAFVMAPGKVFIWIEAKVTTDMTDSQEAWRDTVLACGFAHIEARSVVDLATTLDAHGVELRRGWLAVAEHHDAALTRETLPKRPRATKPRAAKATAAQVKAIGRMRARTIF
jgi:hypothetical protein